MSDEPSIHGDQLEHDEEVVDGLPVLAEVRAVERAAPAQLPVVQAAAVAATGFVAGAADAGAGQAPQRPQARPWPWVPAGSADAADRRQPHVRGRRPPGRQAGRVTGEVARAEVRPPWAFSLPLRNGMDGLTRARRGVLERLLHHGDEPVLVRVAQPSRDRVVFVARAERPRRGGVGGGADAAVARRRPGPQEVPRSLSLRSADRARGPLQPGVAGSGPPGAVRGAGVGDLRAADRVRAGRGDRASADVAARAPLPG